jgi:hypothetical protein
MLSEQIFSSQILTSAFPVKVNKCKICDGGEVENMAVTVVGRSEI